MKVPESFFAGGAHQSDANARQFIQTKYGSHSGANFFDLDDSTESLDRFVTHWQAQGLTDPALLDQMTRRIVEGALHPLQSLRISRLLNDPSDELEPEDKEVLISQILDLEWPEAIAGGTA